jgi:hypothetical protein
MNSGDGVAKSNGPGATLELYTAEEEEEEFDPKSRDSSDGSQNGKIMNSDEAPVQEESLRLSPNLS